MIEVQSYGADGVIRGAGDGPIVFENQSTEWWLRITELPNSLGWVVDHRQGEWTVLVSTNHKVSLSKDCPEFARITTIYEPGRVYLSDSGCPDATL